MFQLADLLESLDEELLLFLGAEVVSALEFRVLVVLDLAREATLACLEATFEDALDVLDDSDVVVAHASLPLW